MNRHCGSCTLCCRLLPVRALKKGHNTRCQHQFSGGCRVYHKPAQGFPIECGLWSCRWLVDDVPAHRPDRAHYVIDVMPDMIRLRHNETGEAQELTCLQVWLDPAYPQAWADPGLLAYANKLKMPILVRRAPEDGFAIFPPSVTGLDKFAVSRDHESVASITGSRLLDGLVALESA